MSFVKEIALCTRITNLGSNYWCEASIMNFLLQMDNCVKDNENRHLLTFLSLLMVRDVFEEVKSGFLVVAIHMRILMDALDICQKS